MARHPHRLPQEHYVGFRAHFLTASTYLRHFAFDDPDVAHAVGGHLLRASRKHGFADIAHTFMRDHVHVLVAGERPDSNFIKWVHLWRQLSGFYYRQRTGHFLWGEGYWDYTLRDGDAIAPIGSYILWNPVRAGLVKNPEKYPHSGSMRYSIRELTLITPQRPRGLTDRRGSDG